jgi:hypothetical protein
MKEGTQKRKDLPCSWIRRINVETFRLSKEIYRLNAILIKIPMEFFVEIKKKF